MSLVCRPTAHTSAVMICLLLTKKRKEDKVMHNQANRTDRFFELAFSLIFRCG